jgi:hypothetical protein
MRVDRMEVECPANQCHSNVPLKAMGVNLHGNDLEGRGAQRDPRRGDRAPNYRTSRGSGVLPGG